MTPETNKNLLLLEQEYNRFGECRLIPVTVKDWQAQITKELSSALRFSKLIFKNAGLSARRGEREDHGED